MVVACLAAMIGWTVGTCEVEKTAVCSVQAQSQTVLAGVGFNFYTSASVTPPLNYQWYHGDVAITYGRYVSLFVPKNRAGNPGQLNSIWFERVYAKRDGRWMFLSHRTVHGPTASPAGVDPTAAR